MVMMTMFLMMMALASTSASVMAEEQESGGDLEGLECAACKFISSEIHDRWARYAYKLGKWSKKKKRKKALKAIRATCDYLKDGPQIALSGEEGSQQFADFNKLMSGGGTLSNLQMSPTYATGLETLCARLRDQWGESLADEYSQVKRLYDFDVRDTETGLCGSQFAGECESGSAADL